MWGNIVNFGITDNILKSLAKLLENIDLLVDIDGLPIAKRSNIQSAMTTIRKNKVFASHTCFCNNWYFQGSEKPNNANEINGKTYIGTFRDIKNQIMQIK